MNAGHIDVLIVGAGPTGLTVANELVRRGIRTRIIDAAAGPNTETRALGVQARSLELFDRQGITEQLLARGLKARVFNVFSENRQILRADFAGLASPYPFLLMIPQNEVQEVLTANLAALGTHVEHQVEMVALTQHADHVSVEARRPDGSSETVRASWIVGADGAHSSVRRQLGLRFLGSSLEENFAVADLRMDWDLPGDEFFAFLNRGRFVAYFPMLHGWHRIAVAQYEQPAPTGDVTQVELQRAVDVCAPPGAKIAEVRQAGRFRINQRRVESHSAGRAFLIGDAAHIHSVVGAQGMNTGIQDAFNLGWKLAAVVRGEADRALLDTYARERSPVARRLVKGTRRITRMTLLRNPVSTKMRRTIAPHILASRPVQRTLLRAISQIDVSYHDDSGSAPQGRAAIGDRAPDVTLAPQDGTTTRLFDLLDPTRHTLLTVGDATPPASELPDRIRAVRVDDLAVAATYDLPGGGYVLIRPDGYIAYRSDQRDPSSVIESVDRVLAQPV
ncbi:2-polyprenyl-6-methoxyphenol hydroxylase-like oxidoreductase [Mycolicibacterium flavescens]|uniref:FAD-dependent monooxygenase n=1 Tax=Mycobacterium neumannii TaxID=2048551 RepID=UPI000B93AA04|nr:FAD-dependent monooxygenase [Mycobacterium neumannii]VEG45429.1 2-polyprenyl-6-methoxyphenol hydroxylase-like oxidoreductase [Mycolicibacterium flavescens]